MRALYLLFFFFILSCSNNSSVDKRFNLLDDGSIVLKELIQSKEGIVLLFLSPECPLCQNYAPKFDEIWQICSENNLELIGVVSGRFYERSEILKYKLKYGIEFPILLDPDFHLSKNFNATITPEVFLFDQNFQNLYSGAIDNWAISLGQKRLKASEHYLIDALENFRMGNSIFPNKTKAVGCFIE